MHLLPTQSKILTAPLLLVGHAGLLLSVRYKDINTEEHKMIIFISTRKNDQYREGHFSNIYESGKVTCPASITQKLVYLLPDEKILRFQ